MTEAQLSAKVTADISNFLKGFDDMRASIDKLGSGVAAPAKQASASIAQIKEEVSSLGNLLRSGALIEGGKVLTEAVTLPLIGLSKEAVLMADKMRQSEIAFTTMLGSAERAGSFLRDLQAFAAATPFEFPELVQSAKKMLALGFSAEQVIPTLTNVGNAVSGLGGNQQVFDRIILALGQMQAKGSVSAEEMKQLAEAGIPAWQALASAIGVTVPEAMEMAKKKQIDSTTAIAALQGDMAKRFGGLMEQQSQTIQGTLANLHDTVGFIMTDIGRELIQTLNIREGLAAVQEFAKGFLDWFKQLDQGTKQVLMVLVGTFAVGGPILVAVGAFMAAMAVVTAPILAGGAIVAGIVAGATLILLNWQKIKDTGSSIWTTVRDSVVGSARAIYDGLLEWLVTKATAIAARVQSVAQSFAKPFEWLADHLVGHSVVPDMVEDIGRHMQHLDIAMTAPARNATVQTGKIFEGLAFTTETAMNQIVSTMNFSWGAAVQSVSGALAQMTTKHVEWAQVGIQIGQQFLGAMINQILQLMAQWALATVFGKTQNAAQLTAHTAMETAKTSATAIAEATRLGISLATNKAMMAGTIASVGAIVAVGTAGVSIMLVAMEVAAAMLAAIAAALTAGIYTAVLAPPIAAAAAGLAASAPAAAAAGIGAIQAAAGAAIVAATSAMTIPAFATGGAVFGPTLALVGENASRGNPEYIGHANQLGLNAGGGGPMTIVLEVDGEAFATIMTRYMPGVLRRQRIGR